jgi:hypothetical protein
MIVALRSANGRFMPGSASVCILTSRKAREQHGNSHEELQALSDAISTLKVFKSCRAAELRRRMQWNSAIDSTASACRPVFQEPYRRQWLRPDTGGYYQRFCLSIRALFESNVPIFGISKRLPSTSMSNTRPSLIQRTLSSEFRTANSLRPRSVSASQ